MRRLEQRYVLASIGELIMLMSLGSKAALVLAVGATITACGASHPAQQRDSLRPSAPGGSSAAADCEGPGQSLAASLGRVDSIAIERGTTARGLVNWLSGRYGVTGTHYEQLSPASPVSVCIYDGDFTPQVPVPPGESPPSAARIVVVVENGNAQLVQSGSKSEVSTAAPTS